jgi:hypothetical protein
MATTHIDGGNIFIPEEIREAAQQEPRFRRDLRRFTPAERAAF